MNELVNTENNQKTTLHIAVRSLVEYTLRSGDLSSEFQGASRTAEGVRAHRKVQKSRPEEYASEVTISHQQETGEFIVEIRGRIDGVYSYPDRVMLDEIKSTTRDLFELEKEENPLHWGQLKCYAYLYALQHDLEELDGQLTYYQLDSGEIREIQRHFSRNELETFFQHILARYLKWAAVLEAWKTTRDTSMKALEFPFGAYRHGQREMAIAAYRTIRDKKQLLAQAPTGIGKTMAALFPAVKAMGEACTHKLFYLTARTTGRTVAEKALADLRTQGLRLKSLTLTAKEKICFNPGHACNGEECEFAAGYFDRLNQAIDDTFQSDVLDRETIQNAARKHHLCPFEFSLDLSLWVDCLICDYNYAFDPKVYLKRFFLEVEEDYTFLIDEAHNFVDRSREMFSAQLTKQSFLDVRRPLKNRLPALYKVMGKINSWLLSCRRRCEEEPNRDLSRDRNFRTEPNPPEELYPLLREFLKTAEKWLTQNLKTDFREELLTLYFDVNQFLRIAEFYDEHYITCFEKIENDLRLKLFCLDPSKQMEEALKRCESSIFFSATLTPIEYFQNIFGCNESANSLILPSPFPAKHRCLLMLDSISTLYKQRDKTKSHVAQAILDTVTSKQGNYLVFFPSYQYMRLVFDIIADLQPELETIIQTPGMTETEREEFLDRFRHDNQETLAGFAVMGGIFGEGIDLVGDRLTGTIIVGVGLPGLSPERHLIQDYFSRLNNAGFEYAYLYPGFNRVLQAAGRVIRTETDRGVILLIDQRFSTFRYKHLFPQEWTPAKIRSQQDLGKYLQEFWEDEFPE